jgi:hypothetical protein
VKLLREPLVHFLLLGAGLFVVFGLVNEEDRAKPEKIIVTASQIEHLKAGFGRTWQRPPTEQELEGLIQDYIREEVLYREAMALGLDRDDTIIRRRLRQKMEFLSEDVAAQTEPTDEELRNYLTKHPDQFRVEERFTFRHIYFNPDRRGDELQSDVERLLMELKKIGKKADITNLGDSFLLDHEFKSISRSDVTKLFGEKFAAKLSELSVGQWQGPVTSGYGVHLIFIAERTEGRVPSLEEVRDAVYREWSNAQRIETNENFYQNLRGRYTVTFEHPKKSDSNVAVAAED